MIQSSEELSLIARENQREVRRNARRRIIEAALTGKHVNIADIAAARGLLLSERENSVFSDAWIPVAVVITIIGILNNGNPAMLAVGATLLTIVWVSTAWKNLALLGVTYERSLNRTRVFPGEPIELTITATNNKPLPLTWLRFRDELPIAPSTESQLAKTASELSGRYSYLNSFSMHGRAKAKRTTTLQFPSRGYYALGPVTYESGDIFTLFTIERQHNYMDRLVVYPQIWPLDQLGLPTKEPFGDLRVRRSLFPDPIRTQGIRDYRPHDRFRDVHWKATARRGSLQTRVYDPSSGITIAVFLNVATYPKHWMGFEPELLERAVSVSASVANFSFQQGWGVGIYANGSVPGSDQPIRVPPSRAPEQLAHILEALAAVTEFATGAIETLLVRESPKLPWAATIVLVTALVTEELSVNLLRLKEAGRRVVLISLADEPPEIGAGQLVTYHIPSSAPAFQPDRHNRSVTEAALGAIPVPEPVRMSMEQQGHSPTNHGRLR